MNLDLKVRPNSNDCAQLWKEVFAKYGNTEIKTLEQENGYGTAEYAVWKLAEENTGVQIYRLKSICMLSYWSLAENTKPHVTESNKGL